MRGDGGDMDVGIHQVVAFRVDDPVVRAAERGVSDLDDAAVSDAHLVARHKAYRH